MKMSELSSVEQLRSVDWSMRSAAVEATGIDPKIRYTLVTYGLEGPNPEEQQRLDAIASSVGQLVLFTGNEGGRSYIGHVERVDFFVGDDSFCFPHIPEDVIATTSWLTMHVPNLMQFSTEIVGYSIQDPSWTWKSDSTTALEERKEDDEFRAGIDFFYRYGIVPYIQGYTDDNVPIFDFSQPIGSYSRADDIDKLFQRLRDPRTYLGSRVDDWFVKHIHDGDKVLEEYRNQLNEKRHVFS